MKRSYGKLFLAAAVCAALFFSCNGLNIEPSATLEVQLGTDSRVKTIKPELDLDIVSYDIYGTGPGDAHFEAMGISAANYVREKLAAGDWLIYSEGKNAAGEVLVRAPQTSVKLTSGATARASLLCVPLAGSGQLTLSLSWPSDTVTTPEIEATLGVSGSEDAPAALTFEMTGGSSAAYTSGMELSNGFYVLSVKLKDAAFSGHILWSKVEAVQIYKDKSTEETWALSASELDDSYLPWLVLGLGSNTKTPLSVTLGGTSQELSAGGAMTVSATANPSASAWSWYLDGDSIPGASGSSLTAGAELAPGTAHSLAAVATSGDLAGSADAQFLIRMVSVSTVAGCGTAGAVDGSGATAEFNYPSGVAVDSDGNVYVADKQNNKIRKVDTAGVVSSYVGTGLPGSTDGASVVAKFKLPSDVALDAAGNLYVADTGNHKIRKITPEGTVSTLAGSGSAGSQDGTGTSASFSSPGGLCLDTSGNIYVADTGNNLIRKVSPAGAVTTIAGSGTPGFADGPHNTAQFNQPADVAVDASGAIYVADNGNCRVRKIVGENVSTVAGTGTAGSHDGPALEATFNYPTGIELDSSGFIYIADSDGNRVRKLGPAGIVITLAGTGTAGSDDGPYSASSFSCPSRLAVDAQGNLIVPDMNSHKIRKIAQ